MCSELELKYLDGYSGEAFEINKGFIITRYTKIPYKIRSVSIESIYIVIFSEEKGLLAAINKENDSMEANRLIAYHTYNKRKSIIENL